METFKDDIKVYNPVNINDSAYYSKIMYKNAEISTQTLKTKLVLNKSKNKAKIVIDDKICKFIKDLSKAVIEITSEKSENFFKKVITVEDCETIYKEALVDNTLHCFFDEDTYFYKSKNENIEIENLDDELEGIALLKCSAVVYTKHSFFIRWEVSQFKIKQEENVENTLLQEYSIKDLPEHECPMDGDPLVKKLEELTLF